MTRIILMGQAPGREGDPARPLDGGPSGNRLLTLAGFETYDGLCRYFEPMNLLDKYPGAAPGGKGDRFPMTEARLAAMDKLPGLAGRTIVFVGLAVAEAFDWMSPVPSFEWRQCVGFGGHAYKGAAIPHTSGVVSFWNDRANVDAACHFFDRLMGADDGRCRQAA